MPIPFSETIPASLSPLIGREADIASVRALLVKSDVRLVLLTGTGGVGKTRLATAVATSLVESPEPGMFPGGVAFVSLVGVLHPDLLLPTITSTLGIPVTADHLAALALALQDCRMLLVLDNFEQVTSAAPHVVALLRTLPLLSVLITSRRVLRIAGEVDYPVRPLELPVERRGQVLSDVSDNAAVSLFMQRAGAMTDGEPRFADRDASTLVAICRRLDGLPLAIELAAARTVILSPAQLLDRLDDRLRLLTRGGPDLPVRHQTLRATIDWSYDLLDDDQRCWLRRLSVFPDGFTLDTAVRVVAGQGVAEVLTDPVRHADAIQRAASWSTASEQVDVLEELVGHSLISVDRSQPDAPRFAMLETVRAFAAEQLRSAGEEATAVAALASACLTLGRSINRSQSPEERERWVETIGREYDSIRSALGWFLAEGTAQHAVEMASSIWRFWEARTLATEGVHWLGLALDRPGAVQAETRGIALNNLANLWSDRSDFDRAQELYTESLGILRTNGSRQDIADVLNNLGLVAMWLGDNVAARERFRETIAIRRETNDQYGLSTALTNAADNELQAGDLEQGVKYLESARPIRKRLGDRRGLGHLDYLAGRVLMIQRSDEALPVLRQSLSTFQALSDNSTAASVMLAIARVHISRRQYAEARRPLGDALAVFNVNSDRRGLAACLEIVAEIATANGRPLRGARLLGAAASERHAIHVPVSRLLRPWHLALVAVTKQSAGDALYTAAWWDGHNAGMVDTIPDAELELQATADAPEPAATATFMTVHPSRPATIPDGTLSTLTQRETEVLREVAKGLGDREIGYELGIGQRTVSTHVANLLTKLAVPSRAAAAAMAVRLGVA